MIFFPIAVVKVFTVIEKGNANCLPWNMSFLGSKITFIDFRFLGFFHSLVCLFPASGLKYLPIAIKKLISTEDFLLFLPPAEICTKKEHVLIMSRCRNSKWKCVMLYQTVAVVWSIGTSTALCPQSSINSGLSATDCVGSSKNRRLKMLVVFLLLLPYVGSISQPGARGDHRDLPHIHVELVEICRFWRSVGKRMS